MSLARNTFSLLATTAVITPIRLLVVIVLARMLPPNELGVYTITITFATISMLVAQIGLPSTAVYRIRRLHHAPEQVAAFVLITVGIVGGSGAVLLGLAEPLLADRILPPESLSAYRLGILIAFFQLLGTSFVGVARGIDRFDSANIYRIVASTGQLLGLTVMFLLYSAHAMNALWVIAGVHLVASSVLVASVVRVTGFQYRGYGKRLRDSIRYGLKSHAQTLAGNLHEQVDIFMLAYLLSNPSQIAIYSIAVGVLNRLKVVPLALADAAFPEIAGRSDEEGSAIAARATRHGLAGVSLLASGLGLAAPLLIPLAFGEVYRSAVPVLLILIPGMIMLAVFLLLGRFFMAINRHQVSISIQISALVLNVGLNVLLIPRLGITGAAIASLCSYGVEFIAIVLSFVVSTRRPLSECLVFNREDAQFYLARMRRIGSRLMSR